MNIIGLCGGSGSGKGTVAKLFSQYGIPSIDADLVYRDLTSTETELLIKLKLTFGEGIINGQGALNRKSLAAIVFSDKSGEALKKLNSITFSEIIAETERRINNYSSLGYSTVIFDAPLLFESGFDKKCNVIISVIADKDVRISRIINRDGIDRSLAEKRIASQIPDDYLIENSDYVIKNNGSVEELSFEIEKLIKILKIEV